MSRSWGFRTHEPWGRVRSERRQQAARKRVQRTPPGHTAEPALSPEMRRGLRRGFSEAAPDLPRGAAAPSQASRTHSCRTGGPPARVGIRRSTPGRSLRGRTATGTFSICFPSRSEDPPTGPSLAGRVVCAHLPTASIENRMTAGVSGVNTRL